MMLKEISPKQLKENPTNRLYFRDIKESSPDFWKAFVQNVKDIGIQEPLLVNSETMEIVSGHQRRAAAIELGYETVPCALIEPEDKDDELIRLLSANVYRRQLDSIQLMELVPIIRTAIISRQGKTSPDKKEKLEKDYKSPGEIIGEKIGKSENFIAIANMYQKLPKEEQAKARDWFYGELQTPKDKELRSKIDELTATIEKQKPIKKQLEELQQQIKAFEESEKDYTKEIEKLTTKKKELNDELKKERAKSAFDKELERLNEALQSIQKRATHLTTDIADLRTRILKLGGPGAHPAGLDSMKAATKLRQLMNEIVALYYGDSQKYIEGGKE